MSGFESVRVAGHRGALALAPENTLAGFLHAWDLGCHCMEMDVRLTSDGHAVCFHDDRLDRLTPLSGAVEDHPWEVLRDVPVLPGGWEGRFAGATVPLLEDVLAALPGACTFLVELKPEASRPGELIREVDRALRRAHAASRCRVISFDIGLLRGWREVSSVPVGLLAGRGADPGTLLRAAGELDAAALHVHHSLATRLAGEARDGGFLLHAWTVNTPEELRRVVEAGAAEITSDLPGRGFPGALPAGPPEHPWAALRLERDDVDANGAAARGG